MIAPAAPLIVTFLPPKTRGVKLLEFVKLKVVNPANVTTELGFNLERLMELLLGVVIFCKTMFVHAANTDAICVYSVAVHGAVWAKAVERRHAMKMYDRIINDRSISNWHLRKEESKVELETQQQRYERQSVRASNGSVSLRG